MKHKTLLALLAAVSLLTACGQVDEPASEAPAGQSSEAAAVEDENVSEAEAPKEESAAETDQETEESDTSEAGNSEEVPETDNAGTAESDDDQTTAKDDAYTFDSVQGVSYTFDELCGMGLGNTLSDGTSFVIVPDSGGAGHAYYNVFTKAPEGEWEQGEVYDELNGTSFHDALSDGSILLITSGGAASPDFPEAYHLSLSGNAVVSEPMDSFFDDIKPLAKETDSPVIADSVTKLGDVYTIELTDSMTGEEIYKGSFQIDISALKAVPYETADSIN